MKPVYIVTGANKGIGKSIVRQLALKLISENKEGVVYLTSRNEKLGKDALEELNSQISNNSSKIVEIKHHKLDLGNHTDHIDLKNYLLGKYGGFDVLINNAGIAYKGDGFDEKIASDTLKTNYFDTVALSLTLIDIIKTEGRVINVSSSVGHLNILGDELQRKFSDANLDLETLNSLMKQFIKELMKKMGGQNKVKDLNYLLAYGVSKVGLTAFSHIMDRKYKDKGIIIRACCPGFCDTDMTSHKGHLTADQGAETPVYLAIAPRKEIVEKSGIFWKEKKPIIW